MSNIKHIISGWWCNNHLEKYGVRQWEGLCHV